MEQSKRTTISVWGCCVSRDSIAFRQNKYVVPRFVQFISPLTVFDGKKIPLTEESFSDYPDVHNFCKRCFSLDATKCAVDFFTREKAEWLLFDISEVRRFVYQWKKSGVMLTKSSHLSCMLDVANACSDGETPSVVSPCSFPEEVFSAAVERLCDEFLKHFSPEHIILHEFYNTALYIDENNVLHEFSNSKKEEFEKQNEVIKKALSICGNKFKGCHTIIMPNNTFADCKHRWGLNPLHYTELYYDYAEKCISAILEGHSPEVEKERLSALYELYNEKMLSCCMWARKNGYRRRAHQAEGELSNARALCTKSEKRIAALENSNAELCKRSTFLSEAKSRLEKDNACLKEGISALEKKDEELRESISELNEKCTHLAHREKVLCKKKADLEEETSRLNNAVSCLQNEVSKKSSEILQQQEHCKELENEINEKSFQILKQKEHCKELENEINKKSSEILKQKERRKKLEKEITNIRNSRSYKLGLFITWLPRKIRDKLRHR